MSDMSAPVVDKIGDLGKRVDAILENARVNKTQRHSIPKLSAERLATSIRRELASKGGVIIRLIIKASPSLWALVDGKVTTGREILHLTSLPDDDALVSLMRTFCANQPSLFQNGLDEDLKLKELTDEERAFLVDAARESKDQWVSEKNPLTVTFYCAPDVYCLSMQYPPALVDYILEKLDAVR